VLGGEGIGEAANGGLVDVGPEFALGVGPGFPQEGGIGGCGGLDEAAILAEVVLLELKLG
jgi:hypothetical protein